MFWKPHCQTGTPACAIESSVPIGPRNPDLARPRHSRSCLPTARAVMRPDHVPPPNFRFPRRANDHRAKRFRPCYGPDSEAAGNWIPAASAVAGVCSDFQVHVVAARSVTNVSATGQTLCAGDCLARGGYSALDSGARHARLTHDDERLARVGQKLEPGLFLMARLPSWTGCRVWRRTSRGSTCQPMNMPCAPELCCDWRCRWGSSGW